MFNRIFRFLCRLFFVLGALGLLGIFIPRLITSLHSIDSIYQKDDLPVKRVAIVFGAGLRHDGTPTPILRDRVNTAASLYFSGKVEKLLMSGSMQHLTYNEPESMRQYALSLGVPDEAIVLDYAGSRTYDTCYRAKAVFEVSDALLVTQKFHLPRAIFLCDSLGLEVLGVEAKSTRQAWRGSPLIWNTRELLATVVAFLDLYITQPKPTLGEPSPLFVD